MSTFATFPICAPRHGKLRRLVCSDLQTCHGRPVCATELRSLTATTGNPDPPHAFVNPIRIREPSGSSPTRELQSRARSGARKSSQSELETMLWTADPQGRTNRSGRTKTARTETTILIPTAHIPHAHVGPATEARSSSTDKHRPPNSPARQGPPHATASLTHNIWRAVYTRILGA